MSFLKGKTKEERISIINNCIKLLEEKNYTLTMLSKLYNVSRQAISLGLISYNYIPKESLKSNKLAKKYIAINNNTNIQSAFSERLETLTKKNNELFIYLCNRKARVKELKEELKAITKERNYYKNKYTLLVSKLKENIL